jgi:Tfp pilus assembly protein PilP
MRFLIAIVVLVLSGCGESRILSYDELVRFRTSCTNKDAELKQLRAIQQFKNFVQDPDDLNEEDRAYNSRLKATIWWYSTECNREKPVITTSTNQ